jgi:hypothetical protein
MADVAIHVKENAGAYSLAARGLPFAYLFLGPHLGSYDFSLFNEEGCTFGQGTLSLAGVIHLDTVCKLLQT